MPIKHPVERFLTGARFPQEEWLGSRPAVIVVDLLKGFTDPAFALGSNLDVVVHPTALIFLEANHLRASGRPSPILDIITSGGVFVDVDLVIEGGGIKGLGLVGAIAVLEGKYRSGVFVHQVRP